MGWLQISTDGGKTAYLPGETVTGRVRWQFDKPVNGLTSALLVHAGKGTRDVGVTASQAVQTPPPEGQESFSFVLPEAPYSFSGKLISLICPLRPSSNRATSRGHRAHDAPTGQRSFSGTVRPRSEARDNPFSSDRIESVPSFFRRRILARLLARLETLGFRGCIWDRKDREDDAIRRTGPESARHCPGRRRRHAGQAGV